MSEARKRMMRRKFGDLFGWTRPDIERTVGPYDPFVFVRFDERRQLLLDDCAARLSHFAEDEVEDMLAQRPEEMSQGAKAWWDHRSDEISRLGRMIPPWHAGGFGHPGYVAEFDHWCKMSRLEIEEVLCLSVGIEPENFSKSALENLAREEPSKLWMTLHFLVRRYEQLKRKFDPGKNNWTVQPKQFVAWAQQVQFETHPEFLRLLSQYHLPPQPTETHAGVTADADKREVDKIAQLFTAMAMEYLGYDPSQARSPTTKEIGDIAAGMGMSISEDTIRKYLKRGARFIPRDWKPD